MFREQYLFLESTVVTCKILQVTTRFLKETQIYEYLQTQATTHNWKFLRTDTTNQMGFPDILLLRGEVYWQIEAKLLKKKRLEVIEDDLYWQFGQIAYMQRALKINLNYILVVAKENTIAFIKGANDAATERSNYPDFIKLL